MPLHPAIVHIPLVLAGLTPIVVAYLAWRTWRGDATRRMWAVAIALQGVIVAGAFLAFNTGGDEASVVRAVVPRGTIGAHAAAATWFAWSSAAVLAVLAAATLLRGRRSAIAGIVATALALATAALGIRTGHLGGTLVFTHDAPSAYRAAASR